MKIKLKGICVDINKNNIKELIRLKQVITTSLTKEEYKMRKELLKLSLEIVTKRLYVLTYDTEHMYKVNDLSPA